MGAVAAVGAIVGALAGGVSKVIEGDRQAEQARAQAKAERERGEYAKKQLDWNAAMAEIEAEDVTRMGEKEASRVQSMASQLLGSQRASFAAQNIALDRGTALDIQNETLHFADADALTIKNNAWRKAWGLKEQAAEYRRAGEFAKKAGISAAEAYNKSADYSIATGWIGGAGSILEGASRFAEYESKYGAPSVSVGRRSSSSSGFGGRPRY